jgi:hypothetical protein
VAAAPHRNMEVRPVHFLVFYHPSNAHRDQGRQDGFGRPVRQELQDHEGLLVRLAPDGVEHAAELLCVFWVGSGREGAGRKGVCEWLGSFFWRLRGFARPAFTARQQQGRVAFTHAAHAASALTLHEISRARDSHRVGRCGARGAASRPAEPRHTGPRPPTRFVSVFLCQPACATLSLPPSSSTPPHTNTGPTL